MGAMLGDIPEGYSIKYENLPTQSEELQGGIDNE